MKPRYFFYTLTLGILFAGLVACDKAPSETSADSTAPAEKSGSFLDKFKPAPKIMIPAGTRLHVALIDGVSSNQSSSGDQFMASLTDPVVIDGKTVRVGGQVGEAKVVKIDETGVVLSKGGKMEMLKLLPFAQKTSPKRPRRQTSEEKAR